MHGTSPCIRERIVEHRLARSSDNKNVAILPSTLVCTHYNSVWIRTWVYAFRAHVRLVYSHAGMKLQERAKFLAHPT